jgi:hypothetical protein
LPCTVKLPLGNKQKSINYAIASKAFKDSHKMNLSALAWIERDNKIRDNTIVFNGLTYGLVSEPFLSIAVATQSEPVL